MKILSPKIHGYIDYLTVAAFMLAPTVFMVEDVLPAVTGCYVVAGALLMTSLVTRYPLGALPVVPFTVHGALEFIIAPLLVAYPWIAGFSEVPGPRNFFIAAGAALFLVWLLTDYRAADRARASAPLGGASQHGGGEAHAASR